MFKQTWWVSVAVVLAGLQTFFAIAFGVDPDAGVTAQATMFIGLAAFTTLAVIGIRQRREQRRRGDTLIAVGLIPSAIAGIAFFWFPPMWLMTVAAIAVIVAAIRDATAPAGVVVS